MIGEHAEILLSPEIADEVCAGEFEVGPFNLDCCLGAASVKKANGFGSVVKFLCPDFRVVGGGHSTGLFAERILIDIENFVIGEEVQCKLVQLFKIAAKQEGG